MAECHPVGFQWVMEAKARGAKVIHIDPRFTRTSAVADQHVPIRVGSDIAFLGGIIRYILDNELDFREYVVAYTNAATILREDFVDVDDLDGVFSGYDPETGTYDTSSWQYEGVTEPSAAGQREKPDSESQGEDEKSRTERGAAYPALDITHKYLQKGEVAPSLDTTYAAEWRLQGSGAWQPVQGTVTIAGQPSALQVLTATPTLVG